MVSYVRNFDRGTRVLVLHCGSYDASPVQEGGRMEDHRGRYSARPQPGRLRRLAVEKEQANSTSRPGSLATPSVSNGLPERRRPIRLWER